MFLRFESKQYRAVLMSEREQAGHSSRMFAVQAAPRCPLPTENIPLEVETYLVVGQSWVQAGE